MGLFDEKLKKIKEAEQAKLPKDGKDGRDGADGYTPIKGVDYFDGKDGYTPIKGVDYFDGEKGEPGKDANETIIIKEILTQIPKIEKVEIDPLSIVEKILQLPEDKFQLKTSHISGLEQTLRALKSQTKAGLGYVHGGGLSTISHDATLSGSGTPADPLKVLTTTSGVNTINADNTANQFLAIGTSGADFAIADDGVGTHTFNLPTASALNRGALSSADWTTFNNKQAAGNYITALTGEVSASGPGSVAATISNSAVIAKVLTGYTSGAGTVSATDTILQAIQKLNGNTAALVTGVSSVNSLTGAVALTGTANRLTISAANVFDISSSYVGQASITTVGTITTGTWSGLFGAVTGANLTNLTAGNLAGTIPSAVLGNSSLFIGTTSIALNRATASQALTGITSIDGSAAKWTTARNLAGNSVDGSANVAFANKFIVQGTVDAGLSGAQFLGALGTGIVKNTTTTGVLSIAVAGDFPTLNQNTTGTAANVTTNANLTGPITSVGNATSIASQTGTGTKFVVDTSPTIITPTFTTNFTSPIWKPAANGTTAIQITKADGSTAVVNVDTTNARVGINTTAPLTTYHIVNTQGGVPRGFLFDNFNDSSGALWVARRAGGTPGSPTTTASGQDIFTVEGQAYDGTSYIRGGLFGFFIESAVSTGVVPTYLSFYTGNGASLAERMRISSTGQMGIGMTPTKQLELSTDSAQKPTTNTWTITSDKRVKKDFKPYTKGLAEILQIKPTMYHFNGKGHMAEEKETDPYHVSVVAQELEKVLPELVTHTDGEIDGEKTDILGYQGHDVVFMLINAVKELKAEIEALKKINN